MAIVVDGQWSEPASSRLEDIEAAERRNQFEVDDFIHYIYMKISRTFEIPFFAAYR